jgi:cbb3-type cytochrome oxidase subunit 3
MLTVFASVVLAFSAVLFFAWNVRGKSHEHTEHLSLLPLNDDDASVPVPGAPKGTPRCS